MTPEKNPVDEAIKQKVDAFASRQDEIAEAIQPELLKFLASLGMEGERSAVVLGAERINVALTHLLTAFLRPSPTKEDRLFESDGALSSFSRKTELAYRLYLMDAKFKQALDIIRRLRNDFAHACTVETLQDQKHSSRVHALVKLIEKGSESQFKHFRPVFEHAGIVEKERQDYLICVMLILIKLGLVTGHMERPKITLPALLDYTAADAE